jgi:hypothetical protein
VRWKSQTDKLLTVIVVVLASLGLVVGTAIVTLELSGQ